MKDELNNQPNENPKENNKTDTGTFTPTVSADTAGVFLPENWKCDERIIETMDYVKYVKQLNLRPQKGNRKEKIFVKSRKKEDRK